LSAQYSAIRWSRSKVVYDAVLLAGIAVYLVVFLTASGYGWWSPGSRRNQVLLLKAFGTCALILLHIALCIGPLARLSPCFLPLLYNRRHLGVVTFLVALTHALLLINRRYGFRSNPLVPLLTSNTNYDSWTGFPFETLGLTGLVVLFLMAATSHNFWQKNLSPAAWKALHMLVYPAYGLLVMHVTLGAARSAGSLLPAAILGVGVAIVTGLHVAAGLRERLRDSRAPFVSEKDGTGWLDIGPVAEIPNNRARTVCLAGRERIAVFRYGDQVSAVTNVCAHQQGPLGEGRVIDGCITCPWHGWEYRPQDGVSPPPYTEKLGTYQVRVENGHIFLNPEPLPPGTFVEPARVR
jgi:nitrite reductase/ring-hydroxylating ferredoxin subunit/DMSO/TMAO reductase YedYZ heme-binding membrane subunit